MSGDDYVFDSSFLIGGVLEGLGMALPATELTNDLS